MEICLFTCSIIFVSYGLQSGCQCPKSWQWQFGAFTLLLAWLELLLYLKTTLPTGVYVLMFIDILWTFAKMFLLSTVFVISFGLTFYMIFFQPVSYKILCVLQVWKCCIFICMFRACDQHFHLLLGL